MCDVVCVIVRITTTQSVTTSADSLGSTGGLDPTIGILVDQDDLGILVDSEIVLSTRYGKTRVFINKTLSTETAYQQDLINRDLLSTRVDSW